MNRLFLFFLVSLLTACSTSKPVTEEADTSTTNIYLVRHAEKADDGTSDPPLTEQGRKRARLLAEILAEKNINQIYSSDYKRTKQTAIPLSRATKVAVATYDPRNLPSLVTTLHSQNNKNILVVGHSNSTPSLANLLLEREEYEKFDESDYDNLLIITIKGKHKTSEKLSFTVD